MNLGPDDLRMEYGRAIRRLWNVMDEQMPYPFGQSPPELYDREEAANVECERIEDRLVAAGATHIASPDEAVRWMEAREQEGA